MTNSQLCKVLIIGAGPSGSIASALLQNKGYQVTEFSFEDKFTEGIGTTFQVQRGKFDKLLADEAVLMRVDIQRQMEVMTVDFSGDKPRLTVRNQAVEILCYEADFVLDACGFGRMLPKLLNLKSPSGFSVRQALFGHIEDRINDLQFDRNKIRITGYSTNVKSLYGKGYALLGNAGEFLDPVLSSGVTIAMKSATLVADILDRKFKNETVDWNKDYAVPLQRGVDTFRVYVDAWYDGRFQDVIFHQNQKPEIKALISSILAGYAWDEQNPYVKNARARFNTLAELCR
jgi:flavin-dependent dehydrogenase